MSKKKYKILIVDDSRFNRLILTNMLERDYLIEEADDGKQALIILQERAEEFSLVLLDIVMPNMDGFQLLETMNRNKWLEYLPVVMISSDYTPENVEKAYRLGASDIFRRPYNEQVLCHRISNTIALTSRHRELTSTLIGEMVQKNKDNEAMISILSHIVETHNGESGAHVQNIRYITELLLDELMKTEAPPPLTREEVRRIIIASSLHDIGKMTVPEEILNKPGKLTDEEFRVMKAHTLAGADMLESLCTEDADPLIKTSYEICRWHHERYDGKGYPDGLKGMDIPIGAQIVALADVYDALTSERCYKPAYTCEQAVQMIQDGQCGAFAPLMLTCLSRISDKLQNLTHNAKGVDSDYLDANRKLLEDSLSLIQSKETGSDFANTFLQKMAQEHLQFKFFFNESRAAFCYTVSPPVLHLNKAAQEFFRMEEVVVEPEQALADQEEYDNYVLSHLKHKLATATPENPIVKDEFLLCPHEGTPRWYQCVMQTFWGTTDSQHYSEVVGKLLPMEGEIKEIPVKDESKTFSAANNVMTSKVAWQLINALKFVTYNVRLLDPSDGRIVEIDSDGNLSKNGTACYAVWNRDQKCKYCTSMECLQQHKRTSKIVFYDSEVFHVVSQYIVVENVPLALEMLNRITDDIVLDGDGNKMLERSISDLNSKLYLDPLTNVYNRRYYDTQVKKMGNVCALAMIDIDYFKAINDTYGHDIGDKVLIGLAKTIVENIRVSDAVVRFGGDEFLIIFESISADIFEARLQKICEAVSELSIDGMENRQHVTISLGGAIGPDIPEVLLKKADEMLYAAKENRGSVEIWS